MPLLCGTNKKLHGANEMKKHVAVRVNEEGNLMWDDGRKVDLCIIFGGDYVDVRADCHWVNFMGYEITGGWGEAAKIIGD